MAPELSRARWLDICKSHVAPFMGAFSLYGLDVAEQLIATHGFTPDELGHITPANIASWRKLAHLSVAENIVRNGRRYGFETGASIAELDIHMAAAGLELGAYERFGTTLEELVCFIGYRRR